MADKETPKLYHREWLNEDDGTAYLLVDADISSHNGGTYVSAQVEIKDCSRSVYLDFYYEDEEARRKRIKKLNLLITRFTELRDFVLMNEAVPAPPKVEAKKKKK